MIFWNDLFLGKKRLSRTLLVCFSMTLTPASAVFAKLTATQQLVGLQLSISNNCTVCILPASIQQHTNILNNQLPCFFFKSQCGRYIHRVLPIWQTVQGRTAPLVSTEWCLKYIRLQERHLEPSCFISINKNRKRWFGSFAALWSLFHQEQLHLTEKMYNFSAALWAQFSLVHQSYNCNLCKRMLSFNCVF